MAAGDDWTANADSKPAFQAEQVFCYHTCMIAALFDIEGTLFTNPMGRGFIEYAILSGRRLQAWAYFSSLMPRYLLHKLGWIPEVMLHRPAIERMAWLLRGYDLDQAAAAFDWVVHDFILPSGRQDVLQRLEDHRRQGHLILIVSSGLLPCLERIGEHLNANGVVGTALEFDGDHYTGGIVPPPMIGHEKGIHARRFFEQQGIAIDWDESYAYADSIHDLSMLELVGHPLAVAPDYGLHELARSRGWEILAHE